ncbi:MAG: LLM class flavin-dependent oxidoreductase, partial [Blastocatellia bacterium]
IGPKPVQKPHPPIYVAGFGRYALERAVKYGAGWNPSGVPAFEWLEDMIRQLKEIARAAGRDHIEVSLRVFPVVFDKSIGAERKAVQGTLAEIKADLARLKDAGVTELIYSIPEIGWVDTPEIAPGLARMEQLIELTP